MKRKLFFVCFLAFSAAYSHLAFNVIGHVRGNTYFLPSHLLVVNVLCTLFFVCLFGGGVGE